MTAGTAARDPGARRGDWRAGLRRAADLALAGVVTTAAALPLVTAGAAAAAGSFMVDHHCEHDDLPRAGAVWRVFVRALVPGAAAAALAGGVAALLAANAALIASGSVPGGGTALAATAAAAALLAGLGLLAVTEVGALAGRGWRAAAARAVRLARAVAWLLPAAAGTVATAAALAWLLPPLIPVVAGVTLFAGHVLRRRAGAARAGD
jgi:hypothetical protein